MLRRRRCALALFALVVPGDLSRRRRRRLFLFRVVFFDLRSRLRGRGDRAGELVGEVGRQQTILGLELLAPQLLTRRVPDGHIELAVDVAADGCVELERLGGPVATPAARHRGEALELLLRRNGPVLVDGDDVDRVCFSQRRFDLVAELAALVAVDLENHHALLLRERRRCREKNEREQTGAKGHRGGVLPQFKQKVQPRGTVNVVRRLRAGAAVPAGLRQLEPLYDVPSARRAVGAAVPGGDVDRVRHGALRCAGDGFSRSAAVGHRRDARRPRTKRARCAARPFSRRVA